MLLLQTSSTSDTDISDIHTVCKHITCNQPPTAEASAATTAHGHAPPFGEIVARGQVRRDAQHASLVITCSFSFL